MPRPTTKEDLLTLCEERYGKLIEFIDSLPIEAQEKNYPINERDKNLRDVLCHLHEWHCMVERWYTEGNQGKDPKIPGEGYTWRTLPGLNREIWKKYQNTSLKEAKKLLKKSHLEIVIIIESKSNDELFSKNMYSWTKTSTLGAYFVSSTSSHYDWALTNIKLIKKYIK